MSEIGLYALRFALLMSCVGIGAGVYAGLTHRADWSRVAVRAVWVVLGLVSLSMLSLFHAFATCNYEIAYVAGHSACTMKTHYRLAALWGGQAGSLLLWLWMLCAYAGAALYAHRNSNQRLVPWVAVMLLGNAAFFLVLTNFFTNPFDAVPPGELVSEGKGLNPLLQHPAMMIHPLLLYTGFVGFAVPFAFAFAALVTGELGTTWFRTTRRWTLFAWSILGVGIMLGGRWAYEVLGWGGYWAWDPVENASFMPWLAGTAYVHSVMIQEKRDMLKIWNLVLIGLTYTLCLFGTFLTRSGIVQSVHAFTRNDWFAPVFLGYVAGVALLFFAAVFVRRKQLRSTNRLESVVSREASFLLNNWVFIALLMVVFWGTMFPVFSEALTGTQITVGPKFFNTMAGPLALFMLLLTGVGPLIAWRRASTANLRRQFVWPGLAGLTTSAAISAIYWGEVGFWPVACWGLCSFVLGTVVQEYWRAVGARVRHRQESPLQGLAALLRKNPRRYGGYIVHLGIVFIMVGFAGSAFNEERLENVKPGDSLEVAPYRLEYLTADPIPAQHYGGAIARVALYRGDRGLATMLPEKRVYWLEEQPTTIPSVYSTLNEDLYLILSNIEPDGSATLKVYRNPLVNWIWIGGLVFILGNLAVMWPNPERPLRSGVTAT